MKNKDRIEKLEAAVSHLTHHIEVLINRVNLLEMKISPRVPLPLPVDQPQPLWTVGTPRNPNIIT